MDRNRKKSWIESLKSALKTSESLVVARFKGLSVAEMTELRNKAREKGVSVKVTQNRLTKLALEGTNFAGVSPLFKEPTLVAYSADPIVSHKVVFEFAKKNDKLEILGGVMGAELLDAGRVKELAQLPTLDEARAKIIAILQTPAGNVARALRAYSEKTAA
jgi:large subunit ribosomal protein L10